MPLSRVDHDQFAFGPAVRLGISGSAIGRAHFAREYGPAAIRAGGCMHVEADVRFARRPRGKRGAREVSGGHKTARWRIVLSDPEERPLHVGIRVGGGPPSFALSLVQSYYVEPLVALALARSGFVALPSAGILDGDAALVIMGRSGSGKSSLSVRALAAGRAMLGDDQVVLGANGSCWRYPRRLRLYPDVQDTAPEAWRRLRPSTRRTLRLRRLIRWSTHGFVAPSLAVPASELAGAGPDHARASRLVVVERCPDVKVLIEHERDASWAARQAADMLADQRVRFSAAADARWAATLQEAAEQEAETLRAWVDPLPISQVKIPRAWPAPKAVAALAARLGTDG